MGAVVGMPICFLLFQKQLIKGSCLFGAGCSLFKGSAMFKGLSTVVELIWEGSAWLTLFEGFKHEHIKHLHQPWGRVNCHACLRALIHLQLCSSLLQMLLFPLPNDFTLKCVV